MRMKVRPVLFIVLPLTLELSGPNFSGFLTSSIWTVSYASVPTDLASFSFLAEDEEDTIAAEEQLEGEVDHAMELSELAREGDTRLTFY